MATCVNKFSDEVIENEQFIGERHEEVRLLAEAYKSMLSDSAFKDAINLGDTLDSAENFIRHTTGYNNINEYEKNATPEERKFVQARVDDYTRLLAEAGGDYEKAYGDMVQSEASKRLYQRFRHHARRAGGSKFMHNLTSLSWIFGDKFELISNRNDLIGQFPIARKLYAQYQLLSDYAKQHTKLLKRVQDSFKPYEEKGIDPRMIRKYFPLLDGRNGMSDDEIINKVLDDFEYFPDYHKRLSKRFPDAGIGQDDAAKQFVRDLHRYQQDWNEINYGVADPSKLEDYDPLKPEYEDTIAGFIAHAGQKAREIINVRYEMTGGEGMKGPELGYWEKFGSGDNNFGISLKNYVPTRYDNDDINTLLFADDDDMMRLPGMARMLHNRGKQLAQTDDFFITLENNLMSFSFAIDTVTRWSMVNAMKEAVDRAPSWAEKNTTTANAIRYFANTEISAMENYKPNHSKTVEVARNLSTVLTAMNTLVLALPNSAVSNMLGGHMGLLSQFGSDIYAMDRRYKRALSNNAENDVAKKVAVIVRDIVDREFRNSGQLTDYIMQEKAEGKDLDGMILTGSRYVRDAAMKIADFNTSRGLFGLLPSMFTMKGSEQRLRGYAAPALFDRVMDEINTRISSGNISPKDAEGMVEATVNKYRADVFYDMSKALGDFSRENKPFWSWMSLKYADSVGDVMLGTVLNNLYMFRHVAVHNVNMFMRASVDALNPGSGMKGMDRIKMAGLGGFYLQLMLAMYDVGARLLKRDLPRISVLQTVNPLQEVTTLGIGIPAITNYLAPSLNLPISEAAADEAMTDLARFAGGVLLGNPIDKAFEKTANESEGFAGFKNILHSTSNILNIGNVLPEYLHEMGADEYYKAKAELRDTLDNPLTVTNYSNDYLNFFSKTIPFLARGETEADEERISSYKMRDFRRMMLSFFGINPFKAPEFYNMYTRPQYNDRRRYSLTSTARYLFPDGDGFRGSAIEVMLNQITKYGRMYPDTIMRQNVREIQ